jgi:hypothetical protein
VAVEEHEASVLVVEANANASFVSALPAKSSFDLGCADAINAVSVLVPGKDHDQASNHGLLAYTEVVVVLASDRPGDYRFPKTNALLIFSFNDLLGVQLNHFLQADYYHVG